MRNVAAVVVHYRTLGDTLECLESLLALQLPSEDSLSIVVVDNASNDGSFDQLLDWRSQRSALWSRMFTPTELPFGGCEASTCCLADSNRQIAIIKAAKNAGYAAGANIGLRFAMRHLSATDFWVLNSDLVFHPASLEHLLDASCGDRLAIYGVTLVYEDDPERVQVRGGAKLIPAIGRARHFGKHERVNASVGDPPEFDYIVGAAMFFSKAVLDEIGYLPEGFFLYYEETEWHARARARGIELVWVPEARIVHKEGRSTGASGGFRKLSDLSFRYIVRNSMLFTEARHPLWLSTVLLFNVFEALWHCTRGDLGKLNVLRQGLQDYWESRSRWQRELPASGD